MTNTGRTKITIHCAVLQGDYIANFITFNSDSHSHCMMNECHFQNGVSIF